MDHVNEVATFMHDLLEAYAATDEWQHTKKSLKDGAARVLKEIGVNVIKSGLQAM